METTHVTLQTYSHPEVESVIEKLNIELTEDFAPIQAKHDAQQKQTITQTEFKVGVIDFVQARIQLGIDKVKGLLLPAACYHNAKEAEERAKTQCAEKQLEINERQQKLNPLKRKQKGFNPDQFKKKYAPIVFIAACIVGIADGCLAYTSFRQGSYTFLMAITAALAIAAVISTSHFAYSGWIMKAPTNTKKKVRIGIVLGVAFLFFAFVSNLRSDALAHVVNIDTASSDVLVQSAPYISPWAVCVISFVLFLAIFFMALLVWKSKEECQQEAEHKKTCKEINQLEREIKTLEAEIIEINNKVQAEKKKARDCYDYASKAIERMRHIGDNAVAIYKQVYLKYHRTVPDFFEDTPPMAFEESFAFIHPQTQLS